MAKARRTQLVSVVILATSDLRFRRARKEFRFTVGPRSQVISITNQYGPISVKPGAGNQVIVTAVLHSDQVEVDHTQSGSRVDISPTFFPGRCRHRTRGLRSVGASRCQCDHATPPPGPACRRTARRCDLEGSQANVEVRDITDAHVHVDVERFRYPEQYPQRARGSHVGGRRRGAEFGERAAGAGELDQREDPLRRRFRQQRRVHADQPQRRHRGQRSRTMLRST